MNGGDEMKLNRDKLKLLIAEKGFSIRAVARASGVSEATLNLWMNHGKSPRLDTLGRLAGTLGVPIQSLIAE